MLYLFQCICCIRSYIFVVFFLCARVLVVVKFCICIIKNCVHDVFCFRRPLADLLLANVFVFFSGVFVFLMVFLLGYDSPLASGSRSAVDKCICFLGVFVFLILLL